MQTFLVDENSRLDVFLAKKLNQSRNQVALLIEKDCVQVNDKIQDKNSFKLKNGDIISIASLKLCNETKPQFEVDFDKFKILVYNYNFILPTEGKFCLY